MCVSNGCLVIYDEMTKDLTSHEVDERMEYWKRASSELKPHSVTNRPAESMSCAVSRRNPHDAQVHD